MKPVQGVGLLCVLRKVYGDIILEEIGTVMNKECYKRNGMHGCIAFVIILDTVLLTYNLFFFCSSAQP